MDQLVPPRSVQNFVDLLTEKGHRGEYWEHQGRNHAFLDGGRNEFLGMEFETDGVPAIKVMVAWMDSVIQE